MDQNTTVIEVAGELTGTEAAVDAALTQAVRLMRRMMEARRELGLPVGVGEPALRSVTAAITALGQAQLDVARTHGDLHALQNDLGLGAVAFGPLLKPAPSVPGTERRTG
ncbi:MAG: hypothetical protein V4466_13910 [Pseudomonadota bacterium]